MFLSYLVARPLFIELDESKSRAIRLLKPSDFKVGDWQEKELLSRANAILSGDLTPSYEWQKPGVVYVLRGVEGKYAGAFKIGISISVKRRMQQIIGDYGTRTELVGSITTATRDHALLVEQTLHKYFECNLISSEWFHLNDQDLKDIATFPHFKQVTVTVNK